MYLDRGRVPNDVEDFAMVVVVVQVMFYLVEVGMVFLVSEVVESVVWVVVG